jgi:rhodanese-related sulfurtransferase
VHNIWLYQGLDAFYRVHVFCIYFDSIDNPSSSATPNAEYVDYAYSMLDPEITPEAFLQLRSQPNPPLLLDVRDPWEFETASLPDSVLMPMGDVPSRAHAELDPDQPIVVMCHLGVRSLTVTMWLRDQGFDHVQSLSGGIDLWSHTIDPTVPRY